MNLTKTQRTAILEKIQRLVSLKYFDPAFDQAAWNAIVQKHRGAIEDAGTPEAFEKAVNAMLTELTPRSLGLLSARTPINARNAINASFSIQNLDAGRYWVFQDVLPGGVAEKAGVKPGDVLLMAAGKALRPPAAAAAEPPFEMQDSIPITVSRNAKEMSFTLATGTPEYKDNPYSKLTAVTASEKGNGVAYLKVSLFPGKIGIDFAKEIDALFHGRFAASSRLLIDLRGNPGGGIGGLALMSYLTPKRLPVGYSRNRRMARENTDPATLPVFDRVPRSKLAIPGLALRFLSKTSVFLYTQAEGKRAYHGNIAILVNEHTTGAAEMLAQFAQENNLATIVGSKTPGRLVSRTGEKLGFGYRLVIPVAAYFSAKGHQIEGQGITPDVPITWSYDDAVRGHDNQIDVAVQVLGGR